MVLVFDIVDLERETQAAVSCGQSKSVLDADVTRSLEDTTMGVDFRIGVQGTRQ